MPFKDISYLELWQPFCLAERNHLCKFGRRHHEEQFCKIILNLVQTYLIHSLLYNKHSTNNITKQLNERDLTVSVSLYTSSPEFDFFFNLD